MQTLWIWSLKRDVALFLLLGECDLVLVHIDDFQNGLPLDIHIRTKIRYEDYSYIESAAIKIGDDILEVGR